jgi:hypothetical protein
MPIEGSVIESVVDLTETFNEDSFDKLGEILGKDREVRIEEITAAIGKVPAAPAGGMNRGMRRAGVRKMLQEHGLALRDPARRMIVPIAADTEVRGADLKSLQEAGIW